MPALDPRQVANTILALAEEYSFSVSQLSLQKIIYFVHGRYLAETGDPLVSGNFEAWRYGPVHPVIYSSFKKFGGLPISGRAEIKDLLTGTATILPEIENSNLRLFIREAAARYLKMTAGQLVDLSHAPNSPWDYVTRTMEIDRRFGARISNEEIRSRFRFHKISVGVAPRIGEPSEESPPPRN